MERTTPDGAFPRVFRVGASGAVTTLAEFGSGDGYGPHSELAGGRDGAFTAASAIAVIMPGALAGDLYGITGRNTGTKSRVFRCTMAGEFSTVYELGSRVEGTIVSVVYGSDSYLWGSSICNGGRPQLFRLNARATAGSGPAGHRQ